MLCKEVPLEVNLPARMRNERGVILNAVARVDDTRHRCISGRLPYDSIEDFENLLHAVNFRRDWKKPHYAYSEQIAQFALTWNLSLHREFMDYLVRAVGVRHVEKHMGELVHTLRMVGFMHKSRERNAAEAVAMKDGTFDAMLGIEVVSQLLGRESRRERERREAEEKATAEQMRELEELARQEVKLQMNPLLNSW